MLAKFEGEQHAFRYLKLYLTVSHVNVITVFPSYCAKKGLCTRLCHPKLNMTLVRNLYTNI